MPALVRTTTWEAHALSEALGAEVEGLDLGRAIAEEDRELLRWLFDEHGLLLFRHQRLEEDDQVRACAIFRPVVEPVGWISNVRAGFHPEGELLWHSDFAFREHPMLGLSLYALELAPGAAPTRWANNGRAHDHLEPHLRQQLTDLRLVLCIDSIAGRDDMRVCLDDVGGPDASEEDYPRWIRPVLWPHPVTARPLLFAMYQQASHFEGMSSAESDEILEEIWSVLYHPSNVYEHEWRVGDFVVWDNLLLQHGRRANPNAVARSLRRVQMNTVTTDEIIAGTGFDPAVRQRKVATGR